MRSFTSWNETGSKFEFHFIFMSALEIWKQFKVQILKIAYNLIIFMVYSYL